MAMLTDLIATYGYLFIFLGTFIESEGAVILGAAFAQQGMFSVWGVFLAGYASSFISDQIFFHLGRTKGRSLLEKSRTLSKQAKRINPLITRYQTLIVLIFRFIKGFRTVTPMLLGANNFPLKRFVLLDIIGNIIWCSVMVALGLTLGETAARYVKQAEYYPLIFIAVTIILVLLNRALGLIAERHRTAKMRN